MLHKVYICKLMWEPVWFIQSIWKTLFLRNRNRFYKNGRHTGKAGFWTNGLDAWTLDLWRLGLWTTGGWDSGRQEAGNLDTWTSGYLDSGRLESWTLDAWILDDWTLDDLTLRQTET